MARPKKVLVVDDSAIACELVKNALEPRGYQVLMATTPLGFTSLLRREQPGLVLVDVGMPALSGDKLVEIATRNKVHDCPIVLHSDRSEGELQRLASSCRAAGWIRKTPDAAAFAAAVERFLA